MVGHRLLEELVARNSHRTFDITIVGEEPVAAYDRVHLTSIFQGASSDDLALSESTWAADNGITALTGRRVTSFDAAAHTATLDDETVLCWDRLILATGSVPFVPPITNSDAKGVHVYRTLADVDAIRSSAETADRGVVIGGGLLGLEAADAVRSLGVVTTVVE